MQTTIETQWLQESTNLTRFSEDTVEEIRRRYVPRVVTLEMLAKEYGMTSGNVHHILSGRTRSQHDRLSESNNLL